MPLPGRGPTQIKSEISGILDAILVKEESIKNAKSNIKSEQ